MSISKILLIMVLSSTIKTETETLYCKKEILESYSLNSYLNFRTLEMYICPSLAESCCSPYDQFYMYNHWQKIIEPKIDQNYIKIENRLKDLKILYKKSFNVDIAKLIDDLAISQIKKDGLQKFFDDLKGLELEDSFDDLIELGKSSMKYMKNIRESFYCYICDFENHKFIDIENEIITMSLDSCGQMAFETLNYSYLGINVVAKSLMDYSQFISNFISDVEKPLRIKNYAKYYKDITKCSDVVRLNLTEFKKCKDYCSNFHFNSNTPVFEGFTTFYEALIKQATAFLEVNLEKSEAKKVRILQEDKKIKIDITKNSLVEKDNKINIDIKKNRKLDDGEKEIQNPSNFKFDIKNQDYIEDPYKEKSINKDFDNYILQHMFDYQKKYDRSKIIGYTKFIKNRIHYFDVEYDENTDAPEDIFKTNTIKIIDLSEYKIEYVKFGLRINKHLNNNLNEDVSQIIFHLKQNSNFKIKYEKLDSSMIKQVNAIDDRYLKNFHRDNFMSFKNINLQLKNAEIMKNYDEVKENASRLGYNIP